MVHLHIIQASIQYKLRKRWPRDQTFSIVSSPAMRHTAQIANLQGMKTETDKFRQILQRRNKRTVLTLTVPVEEVASFSVTGALSSLSCQANPAMNVA